MSITFKQLMEGYQRACVGPAACDVIAAGDSAFKEIVDKIAEANARPTPDGKHLEIEPRAEAWRQAALEGKLPVLFMGARVVRDESATTNEVRFLNSKRPERNHIITI